MSPALKTWTALALVYTVFCGWYTSFGGPLTPDEIAYYRAILEQRGEPEVLKVWLHFMETDTGDDFVMLNNIDVADVPKPVEGVPAGKSSAEVMSLYARPFLAQAARSAAHPVVFGWAAAPALDSWGIEGAETWDQGGLIRYRSRRDLMKQVEWASQLDDRIHAYKIAALEKTVAYPLDPWFQLGDPRLVLGLVFALLGLSMHLWQVTRAAART